MHPAERSNEREPPVACDAIADRFILVVVAIMIAMVAIMITVVAIAIVMKLAVVPGAQIETSTVPMPVLFTDRNSDAANSDTNVFRDDNWFVADV
jgi:hypothetical protein